MKNGMIKKILGVTLVGVMSLVLIGCGEKKEDKLVVGLSADYAPYEFHIKENGQDKIVGFDIEIAKEIAKSLGKELEIKDMEFDSLITSLQAGKVDMLISGLSPTPERAEAVDFSDIYYTAEQGMVVRAEDKDKYKNFDSLKGKKIGAQIGSIQANLATELIKEPQMQLLSNVNDLILELKAGKIDALIVELPVAEMLVKSNKELVIAEEKFKDEAGGAAIAVKKGEKELLEKINATIKTIKDEKKLDKFIIDANELAGKAKE